MNINKYNIEIPKQDYYRIFISVKHNGQNIKLEDNDLMFMTAKRNSFSDEIIFQKSLNNGIIFNDETLKYEIEINSEDTKDLKIGEICGYDITIYYSGNKPKQKIIGDLVVTTKYTLNEVI